MTEPVKCRSCSASIVWAVTESGKSIPIDHSPDGNGNLVLCPPSDPRDPPVAKRYQAGMRTLRYQSHFVTCPDAGAWRKR